jgi:putative FmdB family regulatory protein
MPLYEYQCDACGHRFELIQKFSDPPAAVCASCSGGPVRKLLSSPAFQFKGSGWYITDYARKGAPSGEGEATKSQKKAEAKADTKADKPAASGGASSTSSSSSGSSSSS